MHGISIATYVGRTKCRRNMVSDTYFERVGSRRRVRSVRPEVPGYRSDRPTTSCITKSNIFNWNSTVSITHRRHFEPTLSAIGRATLPRCAFPIRTSISGSLLPPHAVTPEVGKQNARQNIHDSYPICHFTIYKISNRKTSSWLRKAGTEIRGDAYVIW